MRWLASYGQQRIQSEMGIVEKLDMAEIHFAGSGALSNNGPHMAMVGSSADCGLELLYLVLHLAEASNLLIVSPF